MLLKKGIDAATKDGEDETALNWGSAEGHSEVVKWLVHNAGVDVQTKSNSNETPNDLIPSDEELQTLRFDKVYRHCDSINFVRSANAQFIKAIHWEAQHLLCIYM